VWRPTRCALALALALAGTTHARGGEPGDWSFPVQLGTSLYSHRFAALGYKASDTTIADSFQLSEFIGAGAWVLPRLRVGLNLQLTTAITDPPHGERLAAVLFLPQLNWNFWGPLTASFVPAFATRLAGTNQFGLALQAVLTASVSFGHGFVGSASIEVPVYVFPYVSIGVTPLIAVSYVFRPRRRVPTPAPAGPADPPSGSH
jgi:hypothetical protein